MIDDANETMKYVEYNVKKGNFCEALKILDWCVHFYVLGYENNFFKGSCVDSLDKETLEAIRHFLKVCPKLHDILETRCKGSK